jgi:hypothetical protein
VQEEIMELGLVAVLLIGLMGVGALFQLAAWDLLFAIGSALIVLGLLIGVPAGVAYHVRLYRALEPRGALGRLWWLHPTAEHHSLTDGERPGVMRWFILGAAGFLLAVTGCAVLAVSAWRSG